MNSENRSLAEITVKAVLLGVILSVVLAAANAYLGLFAGMTVSASIPAAVVSMGVLRLFRRSNILENNIVQTAASAGESLAAGVIFTLPGLVILNFWTDFNYVWVTVIAGFGGLLGVLFTIPLRRALIVEAKLKFPEGIATAEVLKSGERGGEGIKYIAQAAVAGGLFKFSASGLRIWAEVIEAAGKVKGSIAYFGSNLSPALLSVGYIVGLNIAVLIFIGGALNWLVAIPICAAFEECPIVNGEPIPAVEWAHQLWSAKTRYIGVGGMLIGGLWTIVKLRTSLFSGIRSGLRAYRSATGQTTEIARTEKDMPMKWILILIIASVVPLFIVYQVFVRDISVSLPMAITMLLTGFLFSAVAGYMAGLVGSSNNPISGVTIATVLVSSLLLLFLMGAGAENGPAAAIIIGSVVCCAAAIAGDNMQDLKAGYIVHATPWKQQVMQMVGTVSAALVMAPILMLLLNAYGFKGHSSAQDNPLAAPQANLMASVSKGVFEGNLPWEFVWIGVGLAVAVIILDEYLLRRGSAFRTPVLAVAIGIYLPLELEVPILAGGIIHQVVKFCHRRRKIPEEIEDQSSRHGLLFASGLITGEAIIGILLAIPIVLSGRPDILAVLKKPLGTWPGVILLAGIAYWLYRTAQGKRKLNN
ncbi:OPT family oligopeptide transporter [Planctomycetota bacterium]